VGINVAVVQNSQSIGFAIPVEKVKESLESYERNKDFAIKHRKKKKSKQKAQTRKRLNSYDGQEQWDPSEEMDRIRREMDQLFQDTYSRRQDRFSWGAFNSDVFYTPNLDIEENEDGYVIKFDIKGLNKDKIDIEISDYAITVSGERSSETEETSPNSVFKSKSFGSFLRTIPLPEDADTDKVKTEINEDILVIRLPKK